MSERNGKPLTICLVAGDVSGDQNGGRLARALADLEPGVRLIGVGGAGMRRGGVEVGVDSTGFSTIGPPDSLNAVRSVLRVWRGSRALIKSARPDLVVLIDAETLSMTLARWLRERGVPVVFFFPPAGMAVGAMAPADGSCRWRPAYCRHFAKKRKFTAPPAPTACGWAIR